MDHTLGTTPFGRRPVTLAMVATQLAARKAPSEATIHKWHLFRDLTEAKDRLAVSDRALAVLNALLSFHQETTLTGGSELVVFPSNRELSLRAHGLAPATLRRHLAALVQAGLIIRRDSPNGKRYARKGRGGDIEEAFGFDLAPLVARAGEIQRVANEVREERREISLLRERITILRRDVGKLLMAAEEEGLEGPWDDYRERLRPLIGPCKRNAARAMLAELATQLAALHADVCKSFEIHVNARDTSANESHSERHYQNSNTHPPDLEPDFQRSRPAAAPSPDAQHPLASPLKNYPLGMVLHACPDIADYARDGVRSWRDLVTTAGLVRSMLGISPSAWEEACEIMGEEPAGVVIAAILQRQEAIRSPGGYLRSLTAKARAGEFSLGPVLMALARKRLESQRIA